jgi:hypothetical protein
MFNLNQSELENFNNIENIIKSEDNSNNIKELANKLEKELEDKIKNNKNKKDISIIIMKIEKLLTN